ncbi:MAG TPA: Crp/Fnr family transcriptional regulator [Puia sp.]|nr:Crp/Fnr family transcriptional regulator [Puia sp.]
MEKLLQFLQAIHPLSNGLLQFLSDTLAYRELAKKQYLLHSGQTCRNIYFIESGLLRCFYLHNGAEVCSWFMKEHDVIVSVESFFYQKPSYESIQAIESCCLHYITYDQLQYAYKHFPEFNYTARVLTEKYYAMSEQRLYAIRMQRASERYAYLLKNHPEFILRVPSKFIASYLGITEVTLSTLKGKLVYNNVP